MSFFNLLSFFNKVFEESDTKIVTIASWVLLGALLVVAIILLKKRMKTVDIVYGGISLALSFVLSYIKVTPVQYGGSITLASMLPIIVYSYYFGFGKAVIVGLASGILQFVQSPYILTPVTFILDYLLAFSSVAIASLPRKFIRNETLALFTAASFTYILRFFFHFISGLIYFNLDAIWVDIPYSGAVTYSLLYQTIYLVPDWIICVIALVVLSKTNVIKRIEPAQFRTKQRPEDDSASN